jgi:hypothetical protein
MMQGFAFIAWKIENNPWAEAEAKGPRYIAQEVERLRAEVRGLRSEVRGQWK